MADTTIPVAGTEETVVVGIKEVVGAALIEVAAARLTEARATTGGEISVDHAMINMVVLLTRATSSPVVVHSQISLLPMSV